MNLILQIPQPSQYRTFALLLNTLLCPCYTKRLHALEGVTTPCDFSLLPSIQNGAHPPAMPHFPPVAHLSPLLTCFPPSNQ